MSGMLCNEESVGPDILSFMGKQRVKTLNCEEVACVGQLLPDTWVIGDCFEAMSFIKDRSVDLVLADLPYG